METTIFKVFFSKKKECDWLNSLGEKGNLLKKISDSKYFFEVDAEQKYYYSLEYLDGSPTSDVASEHFNEYSQNNIEPIISHGNWIYFVSRNSPVTISEKTYRNNAKFYMWKSLYQFFFAICGSVLCGYQFFAARLLERLGQQGDGLITDAFTLSNRNGITDSVLNIFKRVANYLFDILNVYLKLWSDFLGQNDAYAVIAIVLPITVVLTVLGALNLNEYFSFKSMIKLSKNDAYKQIAEEVNDNAEQEI